MCHVTSRESDFSIQHALCSLPRLYLILWIQFSHVLNDVLKILKADHLSVRYNLR